MRFILNESNAKYILKEKFILNEDTLTEASSNDILLSYENVLTADKFDKLKEILTRTAEGAKLWGRADKYIDELDKISENIANARKLAVSAESLEEVKTELSSYLHTAKDFFEVLHKKVGDDGTVKLKQDLNKAIKLVSTDAWTDDAKKKALTAYDTLKTSLDAAANANFAGKLSSADIDKFKTLCDETGKLLEDNKVNLPANIINTIDLSTLSKEAVESVADIISKLNEVIDPIITANTIKGKFQTKNQTITNISDLLTQLKQSDAAKAIADKKAADDAEAAAKKTAEEQEAAAKEKEEKAKGKLAHGTDWAKLFSECKTPEDYTDFWDTYYTKEWGRSKKDEFIRNFGKAFTDDLKAIGWDARTNPVIAFMKRPEIFALIGDKFTKSTYDVLHNALANQELTLRDFTGNEASTFGLGNLIFNLNLYDQAILDMVKYLKSQARLRQHASELPNNIYSEFYSKDQEKRKTVLGNIMLEDGKVSDLTSPEILSGNIQQKKLRTLTNIDIILTDNIGANAENVREVASDTDVDNFLKNITSADTAKRILSFLIDVYSASKNEDQLRNLEKELTTSLADIHDSVRPSQAAINSFKNSLPTRNKELSGKQVGMLLRGLADKADLLKKKTAEK